MSIGSTRISNVGVVNVVDEEKQSQLAQLHDNDEDVLATSLIDRYGTRPVSLQNMCLATFAVTYDVIQFATKKEETEGVNEEEEMQNTENDNSVTKMKL